MGFVRTDFTRGLQRTFSPCRAQGTLFVGHATRRLSVTAFAAALTVSACSRNLPIPDPSQLPSSPVPTTGVSPTAVLEPKFLRPWKGTKSTVFWVGESASEENNYIQNTDSAWQSRPHWLAHHGCADTEKVPCAGAKENPFYCALPLQDLADDGRAKSWAGTRVPPEWRRPAPRSSLKNRWIAVRVGAKVGYCQWEDVGPFGEDDLEWVFGAASKPKQKENQSAGLDVSPALANYLGVSGVYSAEFALVLNDAEVPPGPWKEKVTTSDPSH